MSYDFNYDSESGLTPWPMKWTIEPSQYNWEGTLGDTINFTVKAIPDPQYPSAWDTHHTPETDPGMGATPPPPPVPPEPVLSEYIYKENSTMDTEHVSVSIEDGVELISVPTELFFPYEEISYFKDDVKKTAQFPQDVIDDGYDYVNALVPSSKQFIIKTSILSALSTSKSDLNGTFQFKINNDWTQSKATLEMMSENSKQYFEDMAGPSNTEPSTPPSDNSGESSDLPNDIPQIDKSENSFKEKSNKTYDEFYRNASRDDINTILDENPNFIEDIKNETSSGSESILPDELGTEDSPIDKALRDGNIQKLMDEYDYSFSEVMELLRGL